MAVARPAGPPTMTAPGHGWLLVLLATGAGCAPPAARDGSPRQDTVLVGGAARTYALQTPSGGTSAARPLLLAFHGTGESGRGMQRTTALDALAGEGFLVAYLDAAVGNWAEGCACSRADLEGVNDTGFVRAVVDDVARQFPVDRARVYAAGFSQGGLFVQRLACDMADLFAAVASVSAPMSSRLAETCAPSAPVGVLVIQGTLDDAYPYEGERSGRRSLLGGRETAALWRVLDGCPSEARAREWPDRGADGTRVLDERWSGCRRGVEVRLITVDGGRHAWSPSADIETETLLADHFRYARHGR
jgi:polyhydroxybutyrate depolymerase